MPHHVNPGYYRRLRAKTADPPWSRLLASRFVNKVAHYRGLTGYFAIDPDGAFHLCYRRPPKDYLAFDPQLVSGQDGLAESGPVNPAKHH